VSGTTQRNRRWLRGPDSWQVGCLARRLVLLAAVPGSWCFVVPVVETNGPTWVGTVADIMFVIGAAGFVLALAGSLTLAVLASRLAEREQVAREVSWSTLAARIRNERAMVEGATARLDGVRLGSRGYELVSNCDTPSASQGR